MLGRADLAATTDTSIYQVPTNNRAVAGVQLSNRNSTSVTVRLAIVDGLVAALANEDYLIYDYELAANSFVQFSGLVLDSDDNVVAQASATGVAVNVWGEIRSTI